MNITTHGGTTDAADKPEAQAPLPAWSGSLSGFGSEILIAEWEARAKQLDETAEQFRSVTQKMLCSYLEKARAYRKCIEDLRRQMGHESKRQPTENDQAERPPPESLNAWTPL